MSHMLGHVTEGPCEAVMRALPTGSVDFILTDPSDLVRYKDRSGRTVPNDDNASWLERAFHEMHRVLKPGKCAVTFYVWNKVDRFMEAWRKAGLILSLRPTLAGTEELLETARRHSPGCIARQRRNRSVMSLIASSAHDRISGAPLIDTAFWMERGNGQRYQ